MAAEKSGSAKRTRWTMMAVGAGALLAIVGVYARSEASPARSAVASPATHASDAPSSPASPAPAQAATPGATPLVSSRVEGKNFSLEASTQGECKAESECRVVLRLEALGEYHINKEYPYKFKAEAKDGEVEFLGTDQAGKNVFSKTAGDFKTETEQKATMLVRFKPAKAGQVTIGGTYKLSVCSAQNCQLETQVIALGVPVK